MYPYLDLQAWCKRPQAGGFSRQTAWLPVQLFGPCDWLEKVLASNSNQKTARHAFVKTNKAKAGVRVSLILLCCYVRKYMYLHIRRSPSCTKLVIPQSGGLRRMEAGKRRVPIVRRGGAAWNSRVAKFNCSEASPNPLERGFPWRMSCRSLGFLDAPSTMTFPASTTG